MAKSVTQKFGDSRKNSIEKFIQEKIKVEYQPIFAKFRLLMQETYPQITEEMRGGTEKYYGVPVYRNKRIIITVSPTKQGITFSFTDGKAFEDSRGLLEGVGKKSLNLRIRDVKEYKDNVMKYYVDQAIAIDNSK